MDKLLVLLAQISRSHVSNFVSGLSRHCSLIELFMPVNKAETGPVWELAIHTGKTRFLTGLLSCNHTLWLTHFHLVYPLLILVWCQILSM